MGVLGATTFYNNPLPGSGTNAVKGGTGIPNQLGNPDLEQEDADTWTLGVVMNIAKNWTLAVDYYTIEIKNMIALEGPDSVYARCLSLADNPTGDPNAPGCQQIFRDPTNGNAANIDLPYTNKGRAQVEGVDLNLSWSTMALGGNFSLASVMNYNLGSKTQEASTSPTFDWAGKSGCALQIQCQGYEYRFFTTVSYFRGAWGVSLRHQFWPSIKPGACATPLSTDACSSAELTGVGTSPGVSSNYQLFSLSGSYRFGQKYTLRVGIDNLLDKDPPLTGGNPTQQPFPLPDTHVSFGSATLLSTYDPLGRRGFVSFQMDF